MITEVQSVEKTFYENYNRLIRIVTSKNKTKFNRTETIIVCNNTIRALIKFIELKDERIVLNPADVYNAILIAKQIVKMIPTVRAFTKKTFAMSELNWSLNRLEELKENCKEEAKMSK